MKFLPPLAQIEASDAAAGKTIAFDLEEMGAVGPAGYTDVSPSHPRCKNSGNTLLQHYRGFPAIDPDWTPVDNTNTSSGLIRKLNDESAY